MITFDIPGAFMQVDIGKVVHVRLEGPMAKLQHPLNPVGIELAIKSWWLLSNFANLLTN